MPGKMARSAPRPPFGLPDALVAVLTSRLSCRKAGIREYSRQIGSHLGNPGSSLMAMGCRQPCMGIRHNRCHMTIRLCWGPIWIHPNSPNSRFLTAQMHSIRQPNRCSQWRLRRR